MKFEWDPAKAEINERKHGVSFNQATAVFREEADHLEIADQAHSEDEDRFIALGDTPHGVLLVIFTEPEEDVVRILSARSATRRERERLAAYWRGKHD